MNSAEESRLGNSLKGRDASLCKPERKFIGRAQQRIAFISDPDGNSIELMEIPPESAIYRD